MPKIAITVTPKGPKVRFTEINILKEYEKSISSEEENTVIKIADCLKDGSNQHKNETLSVLLNNSELTQILEEMLTEVFKTGMELVYDVKTAIRKTIDQYLNNYYGNGSYHEIHDQMSEKMKFELEKIIKKIKLFRLDGHDEDKIISFLALGHSSKIYEYDHKNRRYELFEFKSKSETIKELKSTLDEALHIWLIFWKKYNPGRAAVIAEILEFKEEARELHEEARKVSEAYRMRKISEERKKAPGELYEALKKLYVNSKQEWEIESMVETIIKNR